MQSQSLRRRCRRQRRRRRVGVHGYSKMACVLCAALRGGKLTVWEGGMKVNAWVYSPTLIANPGTAANPRYEKGLMHITDMIPTLVRLDLSTLAISLTSSRNYCTGTGFPDNSVLLCVCACPSPIGYLGGRSRRRGTQRRPTVGRHGPVPYAIQRVCAIGTH